MLRSCRNRKKFPSSFGSSHSTIGEKIEKVILSRPAVEAGEKLGFLPGDMKEKVDPYLRPLYDALYELFGAEKISKKMNQEKLK